MRNRRIWQTTLATVLSRPPAAVAEARSSPRFCRNRIWIAIPPIAGIARLPNDIATWVSVVGHSGSRIGTQPISAIAYGTFVASERTSASATSHQFASLTVFQTSCGLPTWPSSTAAAISVPIAIMRLVGLTRCSSTSSGRSTPAAAAVASRIASRRFFPSR